MRPHPEAADFAMTLRICLDAGIGGTNKLLCGDQEQSGQTFASSTIRDQKVVLDVDLARVYGVTTKRLNEQFRRNRERFPKDFAFQLTAEEFGALRSQIATLNETFAEEPIQSGRKLRPSKPRHGRYRKSSPVGVYRARRITGSKYFA